MAVITLSYKYLERLVGRKKDEILTRLPMIGQDRPADRRGLDELGSCPDNRHQLHPALTLIPIQTHSSL